MTARIKDRLPVGTIGYSKKVPDKKYEVIKKPAWNGDKNFVANGYWWSSGEYSRRGNRGVWAKEVQTGKLHHFLNPWQSYEWEGISNESRGKGWKCFDCKETFTDQEHFLCPACRELQ